MRGPNQDPGAGETLSVQDFLDLLEAHAEASLDRSATNSPYAEQIREQFPAVEELLVGGTEGVRGVVSTWFPEAGVIASQVFGREVTVEQVDWDMFSGFQPTVFPGVEGRLNILVRNIASGPLVSLDLQPAPDRLDVQESQVETLVPSLSP